MDEMGSKPGNPCLLRPLALNCDNFPLESPSSFPRLALLHALFPPPGTPFSVLFPDFFLLLHTLGQTTTGTL